MEEVVLRSAKLALLVTAAASVPFLWGASRARVANELDGWFVEGDGAVAAYEDYKARYGNDDVVLVALHAEGGVTAPSVLDAVSTADRAVASVEAVASVSSVASLIERAPAGANRVAALEAALRAVPGLERELLSADRRVTMLYATLRPIDDAARGVAIRAIRAAVDTALSGTGVEYRVAGLGVIFEAINEASMRDVSVVMLPAVVVAAVLSYVAIGSAALIALAFAAAGVAAVWCVGLFGLAGVPLNMVTMMVPTIVAVSSLTWCIHLVRSRSTPSAARTVVEACLFSALTSAAAFSALGLSDIAVLRELGIFTAAGLLVAFIAVSLIVVPLARRARVRAEEVSHDERRGAGETAFAFLGRLIVDNRWFVLASVVVVTSGAIACAVKVKIDTYSIGLLPDGHRVREDSDWIEGRFGYYVPVEIRLSGNEGTFLRRDVLEGMRRVQRDLENRADIQAPRALTDYLPRAGEVGAEAPAKTVLASVRARLAGGARERFADETYATTVIRARTRMASAAEFRSVIDYACASCARHLGAEVRCQPIGYLPLYVTLTTYLGTSFLKSLPLALGLNFVLLLVLLRSVKWAALGTIPNALPVLILLGGMGAIGIPLDVSSVSIACIAFGVLVDDTIHLMVHCRHGIARGLAPDRAAAEAVGECGRSISWTTVVLCGAFSVFLLAGVSPVRQFGSLLVATLAVGLVCDLVLVPALVSVFGGEPARCEEGSSCRRALPTVRHSI
jgi:predicted RND superfamily exporter protein